MDINIGFGGAELQQLQEDSMLMQKYCADHFACKGCKVYNGEQIQMGNSVFVCENMGKGKDASTV